MDPEPAPQFCATFDPGPGDGIPELVTLPPFPKTALILGASPLEGEVGNAQR